MLEGFGDKIKLKHVKGKINTLAGYLSRHMTICDIERDQGRTGDPWMHPRDKLQKSTSDSRERSMLRIPIRMNRLETL